SIESNVTVNQNGSYIWPQVPTTTADNSARVRIYDVNNSQAVDESELFNIVGSLVVNTPNGAENWRVGDTNYITWNRYAVSLVDINYSTNNGSTWNQLANNFPAANESFEWVIDNATAASTQALVKVEDTFNPGVTNDTSNNTFNLVAVFDITAPEDTDIVIAEDPYNITWTRKPVSLNYVYLEYSTDGGSNWTFVNPAGNNTVPNTGTYFWNPVPADALTEQGKIRVRDVDNFNSTNESYNFFYIRGEITVTSPANGNKWPVGTPQNITWSRKGDFSSVDISYSWNNGTNWTTLVSGINASNLSWEWPLNISTTTLTNEGKIRVAHSTMPNDVYGESTGLFSVQGAVVLDTLDSGGNFTVADTAYINWSRSGNILNVSLTYSNDSLSGPWIPIATVNASNLSYLWTIPDDIATTVRVNVSDADDAEVYDNSSVDFSVIGNIVLHKPNTGEPDWRVGDVVTINWTPIGTWSSVMIEGSTNGFMDENENVTINASVPAGTNNTLQTYNWTVGDHISDTFRVRVKTTNTTLEDRITNMSDGNFSLKGNLTVTSPNTNVTWYVNTTPIIQWWANGTVGNVDIRLFDGLSWHVVVNNTTTGGSGIGAGSYSGWTIPLDIKSENCRIYVNSTSDPAVYDQSDVDFVIQPRINVTSPVNEQNIQVTNNYTAVVQWTIEGSTIDYVDVVYDLLDGTGGYPYYIATRVPASDGNVSWNNVPQRVGSQARIKVVDNSTGVPANDTIYGVSGQFNIIGKLTLQSPGAADEYVVLDNQTLIQWAGYNTTDMKIYYSLNGGGSWTY
ncbi:MAG: hypothetical protein MJA29_02695, partial [Candidatus Omnitrophica bacterium]|nr:hypothetical protein [Candidatus Omnitrophota bacterium]